MFFLCDVALSLALLFTTVDSFCSTADCDDITADVIIAVRSFSNRHADVMVAESRFLSISNADVIIAARSFFQ
ncbi:hypothetical protein F511_26931 [Dorcoceras hygrometricum]|uniref:Secreted protein n=1 Tax=Dorcoceras hygrometricum TaxID=472368 RepID=A0A2Z7DF70_9LAMI|nr:hypothetical protein F511_26931 [Dorcoceras hygrometricum]